MHNRRRFLMALGRVLVLPHFARAQQTERTYRLCWIAFTSFRAARPEPYNVAFVERLRALGFTEGRNLVIELRTSAGHTERLPELAADLARQPCDVFFAPGTEAHLVAIKQATRDRDTPIVMLANDYDPIATGHIASLAHLGGRITGLSQLQSELPAKRLELLKELLPEARHIAVFSDTATVGQLQVVQAAAERLGIALLVREFRSMPYDYDQAFAEMVRAKAEALLALGSAHFVPARRLIPELALQHRLPSMFGSSLWAEAGGLLSYGLNFVAFYRRAAEQVSMILQGRKPADIPVEQPMAFELVINLKTAQALGLTIPPTLLVQADEVIK
jgi:putative tryptophan/tyrosine transport system substrate-binding protein